MDTEKTTVNLAELNEKQRRRFYFETHLPDLLSEIDHFNEKYNIKNFSILLYHYYHKLEQSKKCKICGKETKFISFNKGYNIYCSRKCTMLDEYVINKRNKKSIETNLEKYGVDNPMKNNKVKEKVKKTNLEKYGVDNFTKTNEYKEKVKLTNNEKYGTEWYFQTDAFKNKSIETNLEKHGVEHHMKSKEFIEKIKQKNINIWGVDNFVKTEEFKKIMNDYYNSNKFIENIKSQKAKRDKKEIEYYSNYNKKYKLVKIENDELTFKCPDCDNDYKINKQLFYLRNKNNHICCTICNKTDGKNTSHLEKELLSYIKEIYDNEIIENYKNKYEIDIYLPKINLGIEFNGIWFHCENFKNKTYHQDKTFYFKNLNINIFHIWEDDWLYKNDIIKSMILNKLGKSNRIYARKCEIKEINDSLLIKDFLNKNHLQGAISSSTQIGLYYNNELVSLMTFGKSRNKNNEIEMLRFCNKLNTSIVGGFSKLLKYYINNYNFVKLISYADISHSTGDLYLKNDFILDHITNIGYYWCKNGVKFNRFRFRKSILVKNGNDSNKSENEIMHELNYYKLYNCGNYKFYITK